MCKVYLYRRAPTSKLISHIFNSCSTFVCIFLFFQMVDWLVVVGVKWKKWENEIREVQWTQPTTQPPYFQAFEDFWNTGTGSATRSSPLDFDSQNLNNAIPQFANEEIIHPAAGHRTVNQGFGPNGRGINGLLESGGLDNHEVDSMDGGGLRADWGGGGGGGGEAESLLHVSDEIQSESVQHQGKQITNINTGQSQASLESQHKMPILRQGASRPVHGRADSLLGHFHGPHFGMIDHATLPKRPPVKGSHSVEGTFLWAVGLFGSVENGAVVLTAVFSRKFKKPLHILVGTLATTDLFISLIYIPSYTYFLLEGDTNFVNENPTRSGEIAKDQREPDAVNSHFSFCNISRSIFVEIASVTLTIKALIALYLYILTRSREFAKQLFSPRNTLLFIAIAWCINFVMLFLPSFLGHGKVDFYPNEFVCLSRGVVPLEINKRDETLTFVYSFTALAVHVVELTIICACFVQVHNAILRGKLYSDTHREGDKAAKINYTRASKITILVFTSFVVCWLPIYIINMVDPEHQKLPDDVHHLVMDLLLLKSAINPTIYIYGIRSLRHEMRLVCMCKCRLDEKTAKEEMEKALQSSSYFDESKSTAMANVI